MKKYTTRKKVYRVEVLESFTPEWNRKYDFTTFEEAINYCKELEFHGNEYTLTSIYVYND